MPRVYRKTKSTRGKDYSCAKCGKKIEPGTDYYEFTKRFQSPNRRHVDCGYPKPSDLSSRKTAIIEDAIQALSLGDHVPEADDWGAFVEAIVADLSSVADEAESVGDEYESSADSMPDSLQQGYQAEAMRDVATRLRDWADELREFGPDSDEPDMPDQTDEDMDEDAEQEWQEACNVAIDDWADEVRGKAEDMLGDMPEYEG